MRPHSWLWPLSIPYRVVIGIRNKLYDLDILPSHKVDVPVISIGNLSTGGTGKTPFVIYLAQKISKLAAGRKKTAIVSRGYKGNSGGTLVVSDGRRVMTDFWIAGDEPVMIAESNPESIVIVDKNRVRGSKFAIDEFRAAVILLDDGFQHRRLKRDLDIVLLDGVDPLGNKMCLPAGFLREPPRSLARADIVILSKAAGSDEELSNRAANLSELIKKPVFATRFKPRYWRKSDHSELLAPEEIAGKKVVAFAGLAKPASFFETVAKLNAEIVAEIPLPDHCEYNKAQLDMVAGTFARKRADWLVTTAKDAVKLPPLLKFLPLYYLDAGIEFASGEKILDEKLRQIILKKKNTD